MNSSKTYLLESNSTFSFAISTNNVYKRNLNFTSTVYREKERGSEKIQECSTFTAEIKVDSPIVYTFIQTDKPIYNPRDDVNFRIIFVEKDLTPRQINNINIEILDPLNRTITKFDYLEGQNQGVYAGNFTLIKSPLYGNWKKH